MAFLPVGLKKQLNKANQHLAEKWSRAESTRLDESYSEMELRTDVFHYMLSELVFKTKELLQPNPSTRARMLSVPRLSALSGEAKISTYSQPEGSLGLAMNTYGRKLQETKNSVLADALVEVGEGLGQLAELRYALDDEVKQNFLEPLEQLQSKEMKEVLHHRKKLRGRKLDFDYKRRVGCPQLEMQNAEKKFAESLELAQIGMHNLVDASDQEHVAELDHLINALHTFHKGCVTILDDLRGLTKKKVEEAERKPQDEFVPKTLNDLMSQGDLDQADGANNNGYNIGYKPGQMQNFASAKKPVVRDISGNHNDGNDNDVFNAWGSGSMSRTASAPTSFASGWNSDPASPTLSTPSCRALFDFSAENASELSFREGDVIELVSKIDDNWFEGKLNNRQGLLPISYVQVTVPLQH